MKRKLINWDVFTKIQEDSLTSAEFELAEAAPVLAKALNISEMNLHCFGHDNVVYETQDGEYVHANYAVDKTSISFENIEQLVLNEESEVIHGKKLISDLVEAILEDKNELAEQIFSDYISLPIYKRNVMEMKKWRTAPVRDSEGKPTGKYKKVKWETHPKHSEPTSDTMKRMVGKKKSQKKLSSSTKKLLSARRARIRRTISDWVNLSNDVTRFVDYKTYGPTLNEAEVYHDEKGNVVAVRFPNSDLRNEAKLLSFDWKTCKTDVEVLRSSAKMLSENMEFCRAINDLKVHNNISDNNALQETLEMIVSKWPTVLYLTQNELSETVKVALETTNAKNFDDQTCDFMAEGILRTAHNCFVDRVSKVLSLAGVSVDETVEDKYDAFKKAVDVYYPTLDESNTLEMQVYVDLYEALRQVWQIANEDNMLEVKSEVSSYLNELADVIEQKAKPTLQLAQEAAEWLQAFAETNLESQEWNPSNDVHITLSGDHPAMSDKAKKGYSPASDGSGDWGDPAPASDGKNYKGGEADKMRNNSWGNIGGGDTYPSLNNPYVPKSGTPTINGEKDIDSDSNQLAHVGGNDTWPSLQNPYVPKSVTPKASNDNLVVDK